MDSSMEESMELPCLKLRYSSRRRGKARWRSKIVGEQIEEQRNWFSNRRRTQKLMGSLSFKEPNFWVLRRSKIYAIFFFFFVFLVEIQSPPRTV
ncbi:hypothetical protein ACOSQ4_016617 [Xanthoceras sorbifolium]